MNIKKKVKKIIKQREILWEEMEALQESCEHPSKSIHDYSWRIGCINKAYICDDCQKMLRYVRAPLMPLITTFSP